MIERREGEGTTEFTIRRIRAEIIEECAKIADNLAAHEQTVVDRALDDGALSEAERKRIVTSAGSRQVAAEQIAYDIRTLANSSGVRNSSASSPAGSAPSRRLPE